MKENDKVIENNLTSENDAQSKDQVKCSSCESTNVDVYTKNNHWFIVCLDCGRKELFD